MEAQKERIGNRIESKEGNKKKAGHKKAAGKDSFPCNQGQFHALILNEL
jgi:hypothetical protein